MATIVKTRRNRLLVVLFLCTLFSITACLGPQQPDHAPPDRVWDSPPPEPPDLSGLVSGDQNRAPRIEYVGVTYWEIRNGWLVVTPNNFTMATVVDDADEVEFWAFQQFRGEDAEPVLLNFAARESPTSTRWTATRSAPGGSDLGFFVLAKNQYGTIVSSVVWIAFGRTTEYQNIPLMGPWPEP